MVRRLSMKKSGYTERGFSDQPDIRKTKYNLYRNCPGATIDSVGTDGNTYNQVAATGTYNMYINREPRFYLTVMWNRQWYHQANREVQMMSNEQDGGPTHDAPQNGYLNRKKFLWNKTSVIIYIHIAREYFIV